MFQTGSPIYYLKFLTDEFISSLRISKKNIISIIIDFISEYPS